MAGQGPRGVVGSGVRILASWRCTVFHRLKPAAHLPLRCLVTPPYLHRTAVLADADALSSCYGVGEVFLPDSLSTIVELGFTSSIRLVCSIKMQPVSRYQAH